MTQDTHEITKEEQAQWWKSAVRDLVIFEIPLMSPSMSAAPGPSAPVGYALYTTRRGRQWISLAVAPWARGWGIGTEIYRHRTPVSAEILTSNRASRRAAEKAGMRVAWMTDETVVMERWK